MSTPFWQTLPPGFHRRRCEISGEMNGESGALGFEVFIWRGDATGSTLLLNGATHGDEFEGPTFLTNLARDWRPENLRGTVIAIPVLHEAAFFAGRRDSPTDQKNLARAFPGDANGSPTEQIAHTFQSQFIAHADFYVDFHSAGAMYEILPWAGYMMSEDASTLEAQRRMARCFSGVWHWGTPYLPGRTISAAAEQNVPAIYLEFFGAGSVDDADLRRLQIGFENLLRVCGLVSGEAELHQPRGVRESTRGAEGHLQVENLAPCDGILMEIAALDSVVERGGVLAVVQPLDGGAAQAVLASETGRVIFRRRFRNLKCGDALAALAPFP